MARESAHLLRLHIEQELELPTNLSARLQGIQLPPDAVELDTSNGTPYNLFQGQDRSDARTIILSRVAMPDKSGISEHTNPDASPLVQEPFEVVLAASRVYDRVKDKEVDALNTLSTTRSSAWSALSGLSLSEISVIAVINLPLHEPELRRFQRLASPSPTGDHRDAQELPDIDSEFSLLDTTNAVLLSYQGLPAAEECKERGFVVDTTCIRRVKHELRYLSNDLAPLITSMQIGDDLVRTSIRKYVVTCHSQLKNIS
jgi:hypothetical protein